MSSPVPEWVDGDKFKRGQRTCMQKVAMAVRDGELEPVRNFPCADCGKPATQYDHRDYNLPLTVEPVCHKCNNARGSAIPMYGVVMTHRGRELRTSRITFMVEPSLRKQIIRTAERQYMSESDFIRAAIREKMENDK